MSEKQKPQNPIFLPCEGWESNKVKKVDNGGPAFPGGETWWNDMAKRHEPVGSPGMTLRDWFAGMALQGELARDKWGMESIDIVVRISYRAADAMIAQRNEEGTMINVWEV